LFRVEDKVKGDELLLKLTKVIADKPVVCCANAGRLYIYKQKDKRNEIDISASKRNFLFIESYEVCRHLSISYLMC
jgi:hypothetical protein